MVLLGFLKRDVVAKTVPKRDVKIFQKGCEPDFS